MISIKRYKEQFKKILNDLFENHTDNLCEIIKMLDDSTKSKQLKQKLNKTINIFMDYHKMLGDRLDYSDDTKIDEKNNKVKTEMNDKNEDIKLFIYNKTKEFQKTNNLILDV